MVEAKIEELERRYQKLVYDFQTGRFDESTFVSEVDKLQFQDDWGRYWMLGSQSGAWHYYDGRDWHQADPRDREKLPFMDDQGRYWQKGAKSGDWYYYQPETGEWVKPGQDDPRAPSSLQSKQQQTSAGAATQAGYGYQPPQHQAADSSGQFEAQLFQDDEGRYWTIGAKTGQWYFYDENGWHPAHEFQAGGMQTDPYQAAPAYPPPQQTAPYYQQPPYQPPAQGYSAPPPQPAQWQTGPSPAATPGDQPTPPQGAPQGGTWYYHDGKQWLKYSTGEPAEDVPPDPPVILEHEVESPRAKKAKPKVESEPAVAEFFEDDEPPVEVVDIEVITVFEAEPDVQEDELEPEPAPKSKPAPRVKRAAEPTEEVVTSSVAPRIDEYIPRRTRPMGEPPAEKSKARPEPEPEPELEAETPAKRRTPSDTAQPVQPRRRATPHEPTIIIPTGSTASSISSPSTTRARMPTKPVRPEPRRAHDDTMPMEPVPLTGRPAAGPSPEPARHRQVTQQLPKITTTPAARSDTSQQLRVAQRARQPTQENVISKPAPGPATQPAETEEKGYTFGDVLRSFPSTLWTLAIGVVVLVIFAFVFIAFSVFSGGLFDSGVAAVQSPTPTLDTGIAPDTTPTPGPTPTDVGPVDTPAPLSMVMFSSPDLGFTLEYPEVWQTTETAQQVIFSPSAEGLDPNALNDTGMRIGITTEVTNIADLLATILSNFPANAETLNDGTISIASQTWTSTQIQFEDNNLGGQGIATIAVTNKDGNGYFLVALAPAGEWNMVQPVFQEMINSFRFGAETVIAQQPALDATPPAGSAGGSTGQSGATPAAPPTPETTATPETDLKPVIYQIQSGDTLLGIANSFGVDVDLLASENGITDPTGLRIGQELTIPFTAEQLAEYYAGGGTTAASSGSSDAVASQNAPDAATSDSAPAEPAPAAAPAEATQEPTAEPAPPAAALSGKIIYPAYNPGTQTFDLWLVDVASGEQNGFLSNASQPAFSKDGNLLAYRSWDLGTRGIFFKDFVGGRGGIVTRFVEDGMPTWAPDGFTFAFASRKEGDRVPRIYIGNQLGEQPIGLSFQGEYPATMPDGRLVVKGCTPTGDCGIFVMGPRGGGEVKIADDPSDTAPAPSPDGSKIAFMSNARGGANNWEIWLMNADGSNPKRLTENNNNDGLPTWSPDGQSIAFASDRGGVWAIWVMNADGSNQRKLIDMKGSPDGIVLRDEPNSKGWLEERISWAP